MNISKVPTLGTATTFSFSGKINSQIQNDSASLILVYLHRFLALYISKSANYHPDENFSRPGALLYHRNSSFALFSKPSKTLQR